MQIIRVDGVDAARFARFHELIRTVRGRDSAYPAVMGLDEARVLFTGNHRDIRRSGLAAVDGDTWLGVAWLDEELLENTDILEVEVVVDHAHRRRGVGSRLLAAAEEYARDQGRTSLLGEVLAPYDASSVASAGTAFAEHHGFVRKHLELHQVMELPAPAAALYAISARIAPQYASYRLVQWDDDCPEEWIDEFCALLSLMGHEVPLGDLEIEAAVWTPERLRSAEARRHKQGRFCSTTVAAAPDGGLAAYSQLGGADSQPGQLYQWDTMVRPEHRGHRLGMAVKLPNIHAMQARLGGASAVVHTYNAPGNAAMIAVNDRLGFRAVENLCEYQRGVTLAG
jgi:GNAT superfamily N-acetyltransferase